MTSSPRLEISVASGEVQAIALLFIYEATTTWSLPNEQSKVPVFSKPAPVTVTDVPPLLGPKLGVAANNRTSGT
jgi:hypothetical protein